MASIIKNRFSVAALGAFIDTYGLGDDWEVAGGFTGNKLYMAIGRDVAWSSDVAPPSPADKIGSAAHNSTQGENEYGFQQDVHAMKYIPGANIQPIVPRINWAAGVEYNALQNDSSDPYGAQDYYVLNSSSQVWICTEGYKDADGSVTNNVVSDTGDEPYAASPAANATFTGTTDGYQWKYLYTVSGVSSNALTTSWMPVNYGTTVTGNDNPESNIELGCDHLMIVGEFDSSITIAGDNSDNQYRQVGIYVNPVEDDLTIATATLYNAPQTEIFASSGNTANMGKLIYQENRTPITRTASQIEQIKVVVEF